MQASPDGLTYHTLIMGLLKGGHGKIAFELLLTSTKLGVELPNGGHQICHAVIQRMMQTDKDHVNQTMQVIVGIVKISCPFAVHRVS